MKLNNEATKRATKVVQLLRKEKYSGPWAPSPDDGLVRLLADARHLCDGFELNYAELDREAYRMYLEDKDVTLNAPPAKGEAYCANCSHYCGPECCDK